MRELAAASHGLYIAAADVRGLAVSMSGKEGGAPVLPVDDCGGGDEVKKKKTQKIREPRPAGADHSFYPPPPYEFVAEGERGWVHLLFLESFE
jgi:hypothetical protein